MKKKYRAYMIYSRANGPLEGATLVFAGSGREAITLSYRAGVDTYLCDSFIDIAYKWLRDFETIAPLGNKAKVIARIPHVIGYPEECQCCGMWGYGVTKMGVCPDCEGFAGDKLYQLYYQKETE